MAQANAAVRFGLVILHHDDSTETIDDVTGVAFWPTGGPRCMHCARDVNQDEVTIEKDGRIRDRKIKGGFPVVASNELFVQTAHTEYRRVVDWKAFTTVVMGTVPPVVK